MTTHDPINAYLSNEMTPDQERQFLISVAASDTLRRALKSEVMIERMITRDERDMAVPHALRSAILAEAGAFAAAAPAPKVEEPARPAARRRGWLGGGAIGAAGVAVGLLLSPVLTQREAPTAAADPVVAPAMTMPVATVPVPVPAPTGASNEERQEQVRTIVIDRFIPGRPVASFQRSVSAAPTSAEQFRVRDYRRDNPLDPRVEKQQEGGIQAGSSGESSPLAPAR